MIATQAVSPGRHSQALVDSDRASILHAFCDEREYATVTQLVLCDGYGCWVTDVHGKRYLDASAGLWNVSLGYGRHDIIEVIRRQLEELSSYHLFCATHKAAIELATLLLPLCGGNFSKVFFTNSGSEAVDSAIKLSRQYQRLQGKSLKRSVMFFERAYHGSTFGAMAANSNSVETAPYEPLPPGFVRLPAPRNVWCSRECEPKGIDDYLRGVDLAFEKHASHTACILIEPIQGVGGVRFPPKRVFQTFQRLAAQHEIVVICDEIATGCYRTGPFLSSEQRGLRPDLVCMGKGLTSGYQPLACVVLSSKLANAFRDGGPDRVFYNGFTSGGHPAACACASSVLSYMCNEERETHVLKAGYKLIRALSSLRNVESVRGSGLMIGMDIAAPRGGGSIRSDSIIWQTFRKAGVLVRVEGNQIIYMPPLTITDSDVEELVSKTERAIHQLFTEGV